MSKFLDAQQRWQKGSLFGNTGMQGYLEDVMRTYGHVPALPKREDPEFQKALDFRRREKAHYTSLEEQARKLEVENRRLSEQNMRFATFIDRYDFPDDEEDSDVGGRGGGGGDDERGDHGRGVLPPVSVETAPRQDSISNTPVHRVSDDRRSDDRGDDPRGGGGVPVHEARIEEVGEPEREAADTGRPVDGATEPDVDRSAGEHSAP